MSLIDNLIMHEFVRVAEFVRALPGGDELIPGKGAPAAIAVNAMRIAYEDPAAKHGVSTALLEFPDDELRRFVEDTRGVRDKEEVFNDRPHKGGGLTGNLQILVD